MAAEPAGLEGDGAAGGGPVRSVSARSHAAAYSCMLVTMLFGLKGFHGSGEKSLGLLLTWIHPLHAVGKRLVGNEVVAAPSRVYHDGVGLDEGRQGERNE
jgi:hypothetical protein